MSSAKSICVRIAWLLLASFVASIIIAWAAAAWLPVARVPRSAALPDSARQWWKNQVDEQEMPLVFVDDAASYASRVQLYVGDPLGRADDHTSGKLNTDTFLYAVRCSAGWPLVCMDGTAWFEASTTAAMPQMLDDLRVLPVTVVRTTSKGVLILPQGLAASSSWPRALPLRPIWIGLIANVVILALSTAAVILGFQLTRRLSRIRRTLCPMCGYNLYGAKSQGCPECGWNRS